MDHSMPLMHRPAHDSPGVMSAGGCTQLASCLIIAHCTSAQFVLPSSKSEVSNRAAQCFRGAAGLQRLGTACIPSPLWQRRVEADCAQRAAHLAVVRHLRAHLLAQLPHLARCPYLVCWRQLSAIVRLLIPPLQWQKARVAAELYLGRSACAGVVDMCMCTCTRSSLALPAVTAFVASASSAPSGMGSSGT